MWIVLLALRRPYTFAVMALLIIIMGAVAITRMAKDIFPVIDIPVVSVIWSYGGLPPQEMERRMITICERAMTTTVNDIEHIESQSMNGVGVIKVYFQPHAKIEGAVAQVTSICQTLLRIFPPGTTPPLIVQYSASNVPILQLSVGSPTLSEQDLYDYGLNFIRTQLATVQGASVPLPYGGKPRQIMVDLDLQSLQSKGLSPSDISAALNAQNVVLPSGTAKMGTQEYNVLLNSSPDTIEGLNNLPVKQINGSTVFLKDVAQVRDGFAVQANIVRENGRRATLLSVLKNGGASTLDVISRVKDVLPRIESTLPKDLNIQPMFDQSIFVRASLNGVLREAAIAAGLTALMILLFLGTWRSTLIVVTSIPLAILCSIIVLDALGQTLNVMTLGGLALAVGILVDDATVEIENIHRNAAMGKPLVRAILDGAQQIAVPAFVSTLCICIVFVPIFFLGGTAHYLFSPLAMAVVFAMMASYFLSRTVVPTMANYLLPAEHEHMVAHGAVTGPRNAFERIHDRFNGAFEAFRERYSRALEWALGTRRTILLAFIGLILLSCLLIPFLGSDFFPLVDAGQFRLHVRTPPGTRIEETEHDFEAVENEIRGVIPKDELEIILDNIGLPAGGVNLAFSDNATVGSSDGEILVALNPEKHGSTWEYVRRLREILSKKFPGYVFYTQPSDIVSQILNFGLAAPIDIQVVGRDQNATYPIAQQILDRVRQIPGAVDAHIHQVMSTPALQINVDRDRALQLGLTQRDVANDILVSLTSSGQVAPNFWINPKNGVSYTVAVQTPQYRVDSIDALQNTPIVAPNQPQPELLSNLARIDRISTVAVINHYNVQPLFDVLVNTQGRDLGGVAADVNKVVKEFEPKLPRGSFISVRGQAESMRSSFWGIGIGIVFAMVLVYFIMVVNFQSWLDPFIIMMALPGGLCGILWMLFITHTTLSVPSLMGAIMSIGVATANSILMVTFANEKLGEGLNSVEAAHEAGRTRLRPVMMTALAMIIGMLPMSLGLGEGGEQNAPLGRAVIGGLLFATFSTLFFVPVVYSRLRHHAPKSHEPLMNIDETNEADALLAEHLS